MIYDSVTRVQVDLYKDENMNHPPSEALPWANGFQGRVSRSMDPDWPARLGMIVGTSRLEVHWLITNDSEDEGGAREETTKVRLCHRRTLDCGCDKNWSHKRKKEKPKVGNTTREERKKNDNAAEVYMTWHIANCCCFTDHNIIHSHGRLCNLDVCSGGQRCWNGGWQSKMTDGQHIVFCMVRVWRTKGRSRISSSSCMMIV